MEDRGREAGGDGGRQGAAPGGRGHRTTAEVGVRGSLGTGAVAAPSADGGTRDRVDDEPMGRGFEGRRHDRWLGGAKRQRIMSLRHSGGQFFCGPRRGLFEERAPEW